MVPGSEDHGRSEKETGEGDIGRRGQSVMYGVVCKKSVWVVVPKSERGEDDCG